MRPVSTYKNVPLDITGSTTFGRYPKMSSAQTYNMLTSDNWCVPFAGYKAVSLINPSGEGRGIYGSDKLGFMFAVIDNNIWRINSVFGRVLVGTLQTYTGDVFIAENNNGEVVFSDKSRLYVYNHSTGVTQTSGIDFTLPFTPGYLTFQNGRIISPDITTNLWYISGVNSATTWSTASQFVGSLQTKPDKAVATIRFPARGNLLLVFGSTVAEQWYDVGAQLFPYQRSQSTNIDYGCLNPDTIAESMNIVCWIAANEKSGPVIMYTNGGEIRPISTDGINFKLATLQYPEQSYGFMFRQDGHLFYVLTFYGDNISYAYDFNTNKFYTLTDEYGDAFIVKRVTFFNNQYYFVSIRDGNLYQLGSQFNEYIYKDATTGADIVKTIPRSRTCSSIMLEDQSMFLGGYTGFTIEQGQFDYHTGDTNNVPRIDLSISRDGGVNFGSNEGRILNPQGERKNRLMWWQLGAANDLVCRFQFWGMGRFVAKDGIVGIRQ